MGYVISHTYAEPDNLTEIALIEQQSFTSPWKLESLRAEFCNPLNLVTFIKAPSETGITGYSLTRLLPPEAEIMRIAIRPEFREIGAGTVLLNELLQHLVTLRITTVYLEVSEKNRQALALYRKTGFTLTGRRPGYYDNGSTAALTFTLAITS